MQDQSSKRRLSRRSFLKLGSGVAGAVLGASLAPRPLRNLLWPTSVAEADLGPPKYHLIGTDGWVSMPASPTIPTFHPDTLAPSPFTTYVFGFRDVTGLSDAQVQDQRNKAQISAPLLWFDEGTSNTLKLTNVGLALRPDLTDSHTLHWHGFRNAIPLFDGEPSSSVAVPINRSLTYFYYPQAAGTYMYHCHFEDTEHVQMGMTGMVFVRPSQNAGAGAIPAGKYTYNDGVLPSDPRSTAYNREFAMFMSEIWAEAHWADAHIQLPEWSDYRPDFYLLNGRVYPDTLEPNGNPMSTAAGRLQYQPMSALVTANSGERVLLRFANLGYQQQSMTLAGIKMRVIGKDATLLRGRDGTDLSFSTNTITIAPGESVEAIFTAPTVTEPTTYLLYNRNYQRLGNAGGAGYGGQMTEVRIYPAGTLPPQTTPNT